MHQLLFRQDKTNITTNLKARYMWYLTRDQVYVMHVNSGKLKMPAHNIY